MAGYIGSPGLFNYRTQKWSSYQAQFEQFLIVNNIKTEQKKTSCLIALMGAETYEILEGLMFPSKPAESNISALFQKLTDHFEPKRLKIAEQYKFWKHKQGPSQTLNEYISEVRKLASACLFPQEYLQDALRHHSLCSWTSRRKHFPTETDLTLDKAIATAQSRAPRADKEAHEMASQPLSTVDAVSPAHKQSSKSEK